jgi:hypothetical protein
LVLLLPGCKDRFLAIGQDGGDFGPRGCVNLLDRRVCRFHGFPAGRLVFAGSGVGGSFAAFGGRLQESLDLLALVGQKILNLCLLVPGQR